MQAKPVPRRRHGAELKAKVLAACNEPGASIAAVALAHGLNANLVRKWLEGRGLKRTGIQAVTVPPPAAIPLLAAADARFLPIELDTPTRADRVSPADAALPVQAVNHVELRRGPLHLSVRWPGSTTGDCVAWLRELTSGLSK